MVKRSFTSAVPITVLAGLLFLTACGTKKTTTIKTPLPPAPVAPTANLAAAPSVIEQGQGTTLTWQTTGASDITIAGLGAVPASGSRSIAPGSSQTYTLIAKGAGGTAEASARVTVNPTRAQTMPPVTPRENSQASNINDVFFDFDAASIRADEVSITREDARLLVQHPETSVLIEGHCDDRGSEEYNLVLGINRANTVKTALIQQGVDAARIKTVSMGKERPFCNQEDEKCWQQNRRDHFVVQH
jgi:peptidoglycan-associated lipoprotein